MPQASRGRVPEPVDQPGPAQAAWWRREGALDRFLVDLLCSEAQVLRPGGPLPPAADFRPDAVLGEAGLGFDSLECLALAAACLVFGAAQVLISTFISPILGSIAVAVLAALVLRVSPKGFSRA